jgi:DNA-binding transcriptional ArsR family regulator
MPESDSDVFQSTQCAERLKALGEPIRLRIIDLLSHGEATVGDIAASLESEVVTVSHHLQILKHADFVTPRREGRFIYYSLKKDLLRPKGKLLQVIDLGCCKLEVPTTAPADETTAQ